MEEDSPMRDAENGLGYMEFGGVVLLGTVVTGYVW
jgi:hypothetical protein